MTRTLASIVTIVVVAVLFAHFMPFGTAHPALAAGDPTNLAGMLLTAGAAEFDDPALSAREAAGFYGLSLPAFWRGVAAGHIPKPFYALPRTPRWRLSWLQQAESNRMLPAEAKELRRQTKLAREHEAEAAAKNASRTRGNTGEVSAT